MNKPLISVIIPARNSGETIGEALHSILNQTYQNIEVLVVDDNSTDTTKDVILSFCEKDSRVRYLCLDNDDPFRFDSKINRNINAGYAARNKGFEHARGEFITFQDADDVSLLNRIETQYNLLQHYNAIHLSINWIPFNSTYVGKKLNVDAYIKKKTVKIYTPGELFHLSQRSKGIFPSLFPYLSTKIPFHFKRWRIVHRFFWGSYASYPGAGNTALFRRSVLEGVKFRKLADRVWPTYMGRGADRDFNFQVAEMYKRSYAILIPLYMWNNRTAEKAENIDEFIV
jgi:glycosyltransferase involved in cell wall biosynthesis